MHQLHVPRQKHSTELWLLSDLAVGHSQPVNFYWDIKLTLQLSTNPIFYDRTKHVGLDCHFIRDNILAVHWSVSCIISLLVG